MILHSTAPGGSNGAKLDKGMRFYADALWVISNHINVGTHRYHDGNRPPSWISKWPPRKSVSIISRALNLIKTWSWWLNLHFQVPRLRFWQTKWSIPVEIIDFDKKLFCRVYILYKLQNIGYIGNFSYLVSISGALLITCFYTLLSGREVTNKNIAAICSFVHSTTVAYQNYLLSSPKDQGFGS